MLKRKWIGSRFEGLGEGQRANGHAQNPIQLARDVMNNKLQTRDVYLSPSRSWLFVVPFALRFSPFNNFRGFHA
jgi:hypothetical protein